MSFLKMSDHVIILASANQVDCMDQTSYAIELFALVYDVGGAE